MHRTLASVGIPALHIIRANNAEGYRFYELTGDLSETLHFSHFEEGSEKIDNSNQGRIQLGEPVAHEVIDANPASGRVRLDD